MSTEPILRTALLGLVGGNDDKDFLSAMAIQIMALPAPQADKAASLLAIRALLETHR